jgi:hypothetical protein
MPTASGAPGLVSDVSIDGPIAEKNTESRLRAMETQNAALHSRIERIERALLYPVVASESGDGASVAGRGPAVSAGLGIVDITGPNSQDVAVNNDRAVTFVVSEIFFGFGRPLPNASVKCTITGTTTGSIADAPSGSVPRTIASLGTALDITGNAAGEATVYVLGTTVESFTITGIATAGTFQPSHSVTINVK